MAIKFLCPYGHRLRVPDHRAGKKGRCPICHQRVIVPVANPRPSGRRKRRTSLPLKLPEVTTPLEDILEQELGLPHMALPPGAIPPTTLYPSVPLDPPAPLSPPDLAYSTIPARESRPRALLMPTPSAPTLPMPTQMLPQAWYPADEALLKMRRSSPPPTRWLVAATDDNWLHGYRLDEGKRQAASIVAIALAVLAIVSTVPTWTRLIADQPQPTWVPIVLLVGGGLLCYAIWLATVPDWSTLCLGLVLCLATTALYGLGMWMAIAARSGRPTLIDLSDVKNLAGGWCAAMVLVFVLLSYALGHMTMRWRGELKNTKSPRGW